MTESQQSKRRPVAIRVSKRAHKLAALMDSYGDRGSAVEFALELALALKLWEVDGDMPPGVPAFRKALRIGDEVVRGDGPLSGDASTRLTAHHAIIVDRLFERAVSRGIDAYRAEMHFAGKGGSRP